VDVVIKRAKPVWDQVFVEDIIIPKQTAVWKIVLTQDIGAVEVNRSVC